MLPIPCYADYLTGLEVVGYVLFLGPVLLLLLVTIPVVHFFRRSENQKARKFNATGILILDLFIFLISVFLQGAFYNESREYAWLAFVPSVITFALLGHRLSVRANTQMQFQVAYFLKSVMFIFLIYAPLEQFFENTVINFWYSYFAALLIFLGCLFGGIYYYIRRAGNRGFLPLSPLNTLVYSSLLAALSYMYTRTLLYFKDYVFHDGVYDIYGRICFSKSCFLTSYNLTVTLLICFASITAYFLHKRHMNYYVPLNVEEPK